MILQQKDNKNVLIKFKEIWNNMNNNMNINNMNINNNMDSKKLTYKNKTKLIFC